MIRAFLICVGVIKRPRSASLIQSFRPRSLPLRSLSPMYCPIRFLQCCFETSSCQCYCAVPPASHERSGRLFQIHVDLPWNSRPTFKRPQCQRSVNSARNLGEYSSSSSRHPACSMPRGKSARPTTGIDSSVTFQSFTPNFFRGIAVNRVRQFAKRTNHQSLIQFPVLTRSLSLLEECVLRSQQ